MPLTDGELRNNYYLAVVVYLCNYIGPYTANDPSTGQEWAFVLQDDGGLPHPQPYIASWNVSSKSQPSDETMRLLETMLQINACHDALYPPESSDSGSGLMRFDEPLAASVSELKFAPLAAAAPKPQLAKSAPIPIPQPAAKKRGNSWDALDNLSDVEE